MNDQVQIYFAVHLRSGIIIARQYGHLREAVLVQSNPIYSRDALARFPDVMPLPVRLQIAAVCTWTTALPTGHLPRGRASWSGEYVL
jgi:hypothetical protein